MPFEISANTNAEHEHEEDKHASTPRHKNVDRNEPRPPERRAHGLATTNGGATTIQQGPSSRAPHMTEHVECQHEGDKHVTKKG